MPLVVRIIQRRTVVLFPLAVSVRVDDRSFAVLSIGRDLDVFVFRTAPFDMQVLIIKYRPLLQKYPVARLEGDLIDLGQRLERLAF